MSSHPSNNDPASAERSIGDSVTELGSGDSGRVSPLTGSSPTLDTTSKGPVRMIGSSASEMGLSTWLPDDPTGWARIIKAKGAFNGAFVPLVLHDPALAERSIDAAEWACDLISSENGSILCLAPFARRDLGPVGELTIRQWNHTAAMIERLDDVTKRFKLEIFIKDVVGDVAARDELGVEPKLPVGYALDTGNFVPESFIPTVLVCPRPGLADADQPGQEQQGQTGEQSKQSLSQRLN